MKTSARGKPAPPFNPPTFLEPLITAYRRDRARLRYDIVRETLDFQRTFQTRLGGMAPFFEWYDPGKGWNRVWEPGPYEMNYDTHIDNEHLSKLKHLMLRKVVWCSVKFGSVRRGGNRHPVRDQVIGCRPWLKLAKDSFRRDPSVKRDTPDEKRHARTATRKRCIEFIRRYDIIQALQAAHARMEMMVDTFELELGVLSVALERGYADLPEKRLRISPEKAHTPALMVSGLSAAVMKKAHEMSVSFLGRSPRSDEFTRGGTGELFHHGDPVPLLTDGDTPVKATAVDEDDIAKIIP